MAFTLKQRGALTGLGTAEATGTGVAIGALLSTVAASSHVQMVDVVFSVTGLGHLSVIRGVLSCCWIDLRVYVSRFKRRLTYARACSIDTIILTFFSTGETVSVSIAAIVHEGLAELLLGVVVEHLSLRVGSAEVSPISSIGTALLCLRLGLALSLSKGEGDGC